MEISYRRLIELYTFAERACTPHHHTLRFPVVNLEGVLISKEIAPLKNKVDIELTILFNRKNGNREIHFEGELFCLLEELGIIIEEIDKRKEERRQMYRRFLSDYLKPINFLLLQARLNSRLNVFVEKDFMTDYFVISINKESLS